MKTAFNGTLTSWEELSKLFFLLTFLHHASNTYGQQSNIVFFLVDDQDLTMNSLQAMPKLTSLIGDNGATFVNAFVASPLCCPSRSSVLTGQYVHNHGSLNNSISGGCNAIEWQAGPEISAFPTYLFDAGYKTFYTGKYLNTYGQNSVGGLSHIPPGWSSWAALKGNSVYYNYSLSVDGEEEIHGNDPDTDYLTNVIKAKALNFIDQLSGDDPFFMMIAPPACHDPFTPEPKYEQSLSSLQVPRTPDFNIENSFDKHWLVRLGEQPLADNVIEKIDEIYRNRLRTLLSVDDLVEEIITSLEQKNLINNTYILYSSDHGYHLGQFSMPKDKREPYEFDIRVPFFVRGPGIEAGVIKTEVTTNIDFAPTFLDIAGVNVPANMDGTSLKDFFLNSNTSGVTQRSILIEHTGEGSDDLQNGCENLGTQLAICSPDFDCKCQDSSNNTFNCLRRLGAGINEVYCTFLDDEDFEEYYDIGSDPYELTNTVFNLADEYHDDIANSLETLITCTGRECLQS